jgi:hypothetical protein
MNEHEFFTQLNDAILLRFESFTRWERTYLSDMLQRVVSKQPVSIKQKQLAIKILGKR